ncbi:MAG TPA: NlpC/P60 family protein [Gaiellales bacterium]|nr:NlpC/P60 family protein [Gaiellales bacterium]
MSSARVQARRCAPSTRALVALAVLSLAVAAGVSAPAASADTLSQKRAEARAAQAHLTALENAAEKRIEAYDAIHQKFLQTRTAMRLNLQSLRVAQNNLKAAKLRLEASLTETYKTGGADALSYLLAARSIGELVDQMQVMQRVNGINKTLLNEITAYKAEISTRQARLAKQLTTVKAQQRASAAARASAQAAVNRQKSYIDGLKASIQKILDEQAAARQRAAEAAAAQGVATTTTNLPAPPSSTLGGQAVAIAEQYLGVPYVYGGASPSGFDCSGLVMYVYAQLGVSLPHNAAAQASVLPSVPLSDLQPGDLVFFNGFEHVGIYVGNGTMIHAPHTGTVVQFGSINDEGSIAGAARVPG